MRLPCCLGAFCLEPFWGCCLFRFLPVVKATDFAGFPFFRCLFPLHKPRKATNFGDFLDFGCLLASSKMRRIPCRQARNGKCKKSNKNQKYYRQNQATPSFHFFARIVFEEPYCKKDCRYLPYYRAPKEEQRQARWHTTCKQHKNLCHGNTCNR